MIVEDEVCAKGLDVFVVRRAGSGQDCVPRSLRQLDRYNGGRLLVNNVMHPINGQRRTKGTATGASTPNKQWFSLRRSVDAQRYAKRIDEAACSSDETQRDGCALLVRVRLGKVRGEGLIRNRKCLIGPVPRAASREVRQHLFLVSWSDGMGDNEDYSRGPPL